MTSSSGALRVALVAADLGAGGAARATRRTLDAIRGHASSDIAVTVWTAGGERVVPDQRVGLPGGWRRAVRVASRRVSRAADRLPWSSDNRIYRSRADIWTGLGQRLDSSGVDVINLHWLGRETISIEEIGRLRTPVVMTLHDMWAFSGAAHYSTDDRYRSGYRRGTRSPGDSGVDWDRLTWLRKSRSWNSRMQVIAPSRWIAQCVRTSSLMRDWPVDVIPTPIDLEAWRPMERSAARAFLDLPARARVVLFGAIGGEAQAIKGADLLAEAVRRLPGLLGDAPSPDGVRLVVFGGDSERLERVGRLPFPVHHLGGIRVDRIMRAVYSAADVMVVPSRQDNLPNTAIEAQACGTPVVAFRIGGLPDVVTDGVTGRLVEPFDVDGLAHAISWILADERRARTLGDAARRDAVAKFAPKVIAAAYSRVLTTTASTTRRRGSSMQPGR